MSEAPKTYRAIVDEASHGLRLDLFLVQRFGTETGLSRRQIRSKIETGHVKIRGHVIKRLSYTLRTGDKLELLVPPEFSSELWLPTERDILFEDQDIIAINKPAGLPTQATLDKSRHHLFKAVEIYLKKKNAEAYAGLHHRLDRDTSGIVVFTKSKRANPGLSDQLQNHTMQKSYLAISAVFPETPAVEDEFKVSNHLRKSAKIKGKMEAAHSGGDLAETDFKKIEDLNEAILVGAKPHTGRMHQIRVHLAGLGLPILGDQIYGTRATAKRAPRMMLHACHLSLQHPVTGEDLELEARPPEDFVATLKELGSDLSPLDWFN